MAILAALHMPEYGVQINPFVPSGPFLYHLKIRLRLPYGFLMFLGGRERVHWEQMGYNHFRENCIEL